MTSITGGMNFLQKTPEAWIPRRLMAGIATTAVLALAAGCTAPSIVKKETNGSDSGTHSRPVEPLPTTVQLVPVVLSRDQCGNAAMGDSHFTVYTGLMDPCSHDGYFCRLNQPPPGGSADSDLSTTFVRQQLRIYLYSAVIQGRITTAYGAHVRAGCQYVFEAV